MSKIAKQKKPIADEISEMAVSEKDVTRFFANKGEMRPPVESSFKRFSCPSIFSMLKNKNYSFDT